MKCSQKTQTYVFQFSEEERHKFPKFLDLNAYQKKMIHDNVKILNIKNPKYEKLNKFREIICSLKRFISIWNEFYVELIIPDEIPQNIVNIYFNLEIYPIPDRIIFTGNTFVSIKNRNYAKKSTFHYCNSIVWPWGNFEYIWKFDDKKLEEEFTIIKKIQ